ncbi:annexin-2 receptor-like [Myotis lucifugus]|uniref:annexin-2 receptor-like n=1 Tax=Myotis lucifugus TaxID=59463 RepID=UPI0003C4B083|nr:annexin-2 receptor-like [Myotis lucifugus]
MSSCPKISAMEPHFLLDHDALRQAWDSADPAPERHPPWTPISPDQLPPVLVPLAQSSSHHGDDHPPLLSSPCWQLPSVLLRYRALLAEAQSSSEESPVQPGAGLLPGFVPMPGVPAGAPEPTEHTFGQLPVVLRPNAHAGEGPVDTEAWDHVQPSGCSPAPGPTGWRLHLLCSGCLQCILRALSSLSRWAADCWATVLDL